MSPESFDFHTCWFLTGPTASGKTALSLRLAERLGAEIISLDSMALYRGMNIGTAKPAAEQRAAVPHHLIDLIEPHEEFSLARYLEAAEQIARDIRRRGREVLFVGGTPLYLKGLLRGVFEGPAADWDLRRTLETEEQRLGPGYLHARLAEVDPESAERLHPNDTRRLVRALEVHQKTGQPISRLQQQFERARSADQCRVFVLDWPREELHRRIDRRVEAMFAGGLVDEVRGLLARPGSLSRTARQAVGYREVIAHLEHSVPLDETVEQVKQHTRQFARRQMTWFRSLSECRLLPTADSAGPTELAETILRLGRAESGKSA